MFISAATAEAYTAAQLEQMVGMTSSVFLNFGNGHFQLSVRELAMNAREYSYKNLVDDPAIEWTTFVVVNGKITGVRFAAPETVVVVAPPVRVRPPDRVPSNTSKSMVSIGNGRCTRG